MSEQKKQPENGKMATQSPAKQEHAGKMPNQQGNQKKPFLKRYGAFFLLLIAGVVADARSCVIAAVAASRGSRPQAAPSRMAASRTVRAIGPGWL